MRCFVQSEYCCFLAQPNLNRLQQPGRAFCPRWLLRVSPLWFCPYWWTGDSSVRFTEIGQRATLDAIFVLVLIPRLRQKDPPRFFRIHEGGWCSRKEQTLKSLS